MGSGLNHQFQALKTCTILIFIQIIQVVIMIRPHNSFITARVLEWTRRNFGGLQGMFGSGASYQKPYANE